MKAGIDASLKRDKELQSIDYEFSRENMEFVANIHAAQGTDRIVEASDKIINKYLAQGLGKTKFFIYQGVKVCPVGGTEEVCKILNMPYETHRHGANAKGTLVNEF